MTENISEMELKDRTITIVSGLPRSGTSMMMKMLEEGGHATLSDGIRTPDEDNPKGYYELEEVKGLIRGVNDWVHRARGRAVKIVSPLLRYLPDDETYRIVIMRRKMEEILASQRLMLAHRGEPTRNMDDRKLAEIYEKDLRAVEQWMGLRPNVSAIFVSYNQLIEDPMAELYRIRQFFDDALELEAMKRVIDQSLYRQRR